MQDKSPGSASRNNFLKFVWCVAAEQNDNNSNENLIFSHSRMASKQLSKRKSRRFECRFLLPYRVWLFGRRQINKCLPPNNPTLQIYFALIYLYLLSTLIADEIFDKDNKENYSISWSIISSASAYNNISERCNLCLTEKLHIIKADKACNLNRRNKVNTQGKDQLLTLGLQFLLLKLSRNDAPFFSPFAKQWIYIYIYIYIYIFIQ